MGLPGGSARGLPGGTGLGNRLIGAGLVLAEDREAVALGLGVGAFDQIFLGAVSGSVTVTGPAFRRRCTVPV